MTKSYFKNSQNNGKISCKYKIHWICEKILHQKTIISMPLVIGHLESCYSKKLKALIKAM